MDFKQSELPFIKELLREQKCFEEFSKLEPATDIPRCVEHSALNIYTVTLPRLKEESVGVYSDVTERFQDQSLVAPSRAVESTTIKKPPNQLLIPEVDVGNVQRHGEAEQAQTSNGKLHWEIEVLCSKRKHKEIDTQAKDNKNLIEPLDEGAKKSRKKRMDEWSSEEVIMLLQCTKLLINCELKCISRALFPFIRRSPGKCWGRAAEKKLKRMNIFGNWRQSNKVDVLGRINQKLQELGNPPVSKELIVVTDQIKMQVETSTFQESASKFHPGSIEQIQIDY